MTGAGSVDGLLAFQPEVISDVVGGGVGFDAGGASSD